MTKSRKRYTDEFKIDAVRLVLDEGLSKAEVSRRLGVGQDSLGKWVRAYKSTNGNAFTGKVELTEEQKELRRLRIENRELRMEREILKKATVISTGRCNSFFQYLCWGSKAQRFSWSRV